MICLPHKKHNMTNEEIFQQFENWWRLPQDATNSKELAYNAFLFGVHLETDLTEEELKQITYYSTANSGIRAN